MSALCEYSEHLKLRLGRMAAMRAAIAAYQPAQKWLKDRKGRQLSFDNVKHYQSILKILFETDRIMQTIEMEFET